MKKFLTYLIVIVFLVNGISFTTSFAESGLVSSDDEEGSSQEVAENFATEEDVDKSDELQANEFEELDESDNSLENLDETNQSQEDLEKSIDIEFLYIDEIALEVEATQSIVISFTEEISNMKDIALTYENSTGKEFQMVEKERTDKSVLFEKTFSVQAVGDYKLTTISYVIDEEYCTIFLDDLQLENVEFSVTEAQVDSEGVVTVDVENIETLENEIEDTLEE